MNIKCEKCGKKVFVRSKRDSEHITCPGCANVFVIDESQIQAMREQNVKKSVVDRTKKKPGKSSILLFVAIFIGSALVIGVSAYLWFSHLKEEDLKARVMKSIEETHGLFGK